MSKVPEGVVISGHLYLEADALLKNMRKAKKAATKSYEAFYERKIKEWIEDGEDVDTQLGTVLSNFRILEKLFNNSEKSSFIV